MSSRILIIDDEDAFSSALAAFLEENQLSPIVIPSLAEARQFLKSEPPPNMILLDVMLKDGNGLIFMNELQKQQHTKEIPVIMMSAVRNTGPDRVAGLEFGAIDYLNKPFDFREMVFRIKRHLSSGGPRSNFDIDNRTSDVHTTPEFDVPVEMAPDEDNSRDDLVVVDLDPEDSVPSHSYLMSDWIHLLLSPSRFIEHVSPERQKKLGWASLVLTSVGWAIQVGVSNRSFGAMFVGALVLTGVAAGTVSMVGWIVQWVLGLKNIRINLSALLVNILNGLVPLSVSSLLGVVYVLGARGRVGEFTLGPLLFFPSQISSNTLGYLLRRLDFFEIWSVFLLGLFLCRFFQTNRKVVWSWTVALWGGLIVLCGVVRWIFV